MGVLPNVDDLLHWPGGGYVDTSINPPVVRVVASTRRRPGGSDSSDAPEDPQHWATPGSIVRWGEGYLMTGKMGYLWVFDSPIYAWYADRPSGPWQVVRDDDCEPADIAADHPGFPQARWHYGGILVTDVQGASISDPMLVFSTNGFVCDDENPCTTDTDVMKNVYLYGPHFLRPTGLPAASEAAALIMGAC